MPEWKLPYNGSDPAIDYLPAALGPVGSRLAGMAVDYGHWDAQLAGCVNAMVGRPGVDSDYATSLLSTNTLAFYGERLCNRIPAAPPLIRASHAPESASSIQQKI